MSEQEQEQLQEAAHEWQLARNIIANALREWGFAYTDTRANEFAAALLARLAHHSPPIVTEVQDGKRAGQLARKILDGLPAWESEAAQHGQAMQSTQAFDDVMLDHLKETIGEVVG